MSRSSLPHPLHAIPQAYTESAASSSSSAAQQQIYPLPPLHRHQEQQHTIHHPISIQHQPAQHAHPSHRSDSTVPPPLTHPASYHHASSSSAGASGSRLPPASERRLTKVLGHVAHLRKLDQESIDKRREKRHAYRHKDDDGKSDNIAQACMTCRKAKTKCLNRDGEPCARCTMAGDRCTYPPQKKRGRRTDTRRVVHRAQSLRLANSSLQDLLDQIENEVTTILLSASADDVPLNSLTDDGTVPPDPEDATHTALQNPLGILATAAIDHGMDDASGGPAKYWNSIYAVKAETDFSQDPVLLGLLTEDDLTRLIAFYFANLRPFFMHLDPIVHTPAFLRLNSPFLTSAIASVAANYDPNSQHLAAGLTSHAHNLANRVFAEGYKSLEVVQAYLAIIHWAARFPPFWSEDRSWAFQGQAMRLACEIRLDLPPNRDTLSCYRFTRQLTEEETERLLACRGRTYLLVSLSEIAMASQSGRADTTSGHRLLRRGSGVPRQSAQGRANAELTAAPAIPFLPPGDDTNDRFVSSTRLNHIFARALHHWHDAGKDTATKGEREQFMLSWRRDLDDWHNTRHDTADRLVEVHCTNHHIMLILLTLRIRGSHDSTLALLKEMNGLAVHLIGIVHQWLHEVDFYGPGGLAYSHDFLIVNIAYAAVLCRKVDWLCLSSSPQSGTDIDSAVHIDRALFILDNIIAARPNMGTSTAGILAAQIRRLCNTQLTAPHDHKYATQAALPDLSFLQSPQRHYEFDFTLPTLPSFDETDPFLEMMK